MKVVSLFKLREDLIEYINSIGSYTYLDCNNINIEDLKEAEIIVGNIDQSLLQYCENLKYLQLLSAGSDTYKDSIHDQFVLCNASGTFGANISEHLLMGTLMLFRNMIHYNQSHNNHDYAPLRFNKTIYNSCFVICGCGDIGTQFASRIKSLGGHTIGVRKRNNDPKLYYDEMYTSEHLNDVLPKADVVALCLPRNEDTNHFIDEKQLSLLKKDCIILNVGRSNAINTNKLCEYLNEEKIGGALLDVFDKEPIPNDDPIWNTKNLIITPHVSGTFANTYTYDLFYDLLKENLVLYKENKPLKNIVDKASGYRIDSI